MMKREDWVKCIEEYETQKNEVTQTAFCKKRNISLSNFKNYLTLSRKADLPDSRGSAKFIEARIKEESSDSELRLRIKEGVELLIPEGFSTGNLKRFLKVLL